MLQLRQLPDGAYIFEGTPPGMESLPSRLGTRKAEVLVGTWLVLCVPVWSFADRAAADVAAQIAAEVEGLTVALLPFDHYEELEEWCPQLQERGATPV